MIEHFHFIQPFWLLALLPLALVVWMIDRRQHANTPWRRIVDAQLLPLLLGKQTGQRSKMPLWLLSGGGLLAVLALADPTWEQQPQPLRQTTTSRVIVLDLSRSMLTPDLKPSRLVRARFKVEDILAHDAEGQTGLVVFAGDAFTVSPLTRDADTIRAQLKALHPSIMPSQGSRADLGLLKAHELLQQAGVKSGQVILLADGVEGGGAVAAAARLNTSGYRVSVLGVGTAEGAPLPDGRGGTLLDTSGKPLVPVLEGKALAAVAQAGDGHYAAFHAGQSDLGQLLRAETSAGDSVESDDLQTQKWKGQGPLLAAMLLPLAALAFRRGWLLGVLLCVGTLLPPQPAMALGWEQLWQRQDQQAAQALQTGQYEQAARLAEDPSQRGSAFYKQGEFEKALQDFEQTQGVDADYNRGNALARLGRYKEAVSAYDRALEQQPGMEDALANKAAVEDLLNQQRRQDQESSDQQDTGDPSSQEQQAASDPSESDQADSAQQDQDKQADSGDSGKPESPSQSEQGQTSQPQSGDQGKPEKSRDDADNQFAEANRQLDKGRDDEQSEQETAAEQQKQDEGQQPADREVAAQPQATGDQTQPQNPEAEALNSEEQMAAQQWLRRIPDDPGGLLRRKFLYQYRQRAGRSDAGRQQAW